MVKVSFVCPVFNKEKYLPLVLDALKKQTGQFEKEYIFINDGSEDNSLECLKSITKKWKNTKMELVKRIKVQLAPPKEV